MRACISEHDGRLELVITGEDYLEHILMNAFLRENRNANYIGENALPISVNRGNGRWTLTLGTCECARRADLTTEKGTADER